MRLRKSRGCGEAGISLIGQHLRGQGCHGVKTGLTQENEVDLQVRLKLVKMVGVILGWVNKTAREK